MACPLIDKVIDPQGKVLGADVLAPEEPEAAQNPFLGTHHFEAFLQTQQPTKLRQLQVSP
jgi:hypothetical protein